MKRKPSVTDIYDDGSSSSDAYASTPAFSPKQCKRMKFTSLERRLAHMSLDGPIIPDSISTPTRLEDVQVSLPKAFPESSSLHASPTQNHLNVIFPSSIEEPSSPESDFEPADMDIEPELATSDIAPAGVSHTADLDWDSMGSGQLDAREIHISCAVLERLREQTRRPWLIPVPPQTSQALILYRPPQLPSPKIPEDVCDDQPDQRGPSWATPLVAEEGMMGIE